MDILIEYSVVFLQFDTQALLSSPPSNPPPQLKQADVEIVFTYVEDMVA